MRLAAFQCAIPKDRRNEIGRSLVIDSIFDQTPITFFETAEVKKLGREGDLIQRNLEPLRVCRRPISPYYATISSVFRFA